LDVAIVIAWWIALLGALVLTAIAVLEIVRVVHHAREIDRLAKVALPAAVGIVENTAIIAALEGVVPVVGRLAAGAGALADERLDRPESRGREARTGWRARLMELLLTILSGLALWLFLGVLVLMLDRIRGSLSGINATIAKVAMGVRAIEAETAILKTELPTTATALTQITAGAEAVAGVLASADQRLAALAPQEA